MKVTNDSSFIVLIFLLFILTTTVSRRLKSYFFITHADILVGIGGVFISPTD